MWKKEIQYPWESTEIHENIQRKKCNIYVRMKDHLVKLGKWALILALQGNFPSNASEKNRTGKEVSNLYWSEKTISTNRRKLRRKKKNHRPISKHGWVQDKWQSSVLINKQRQKMYISRPARGPEPVLCSGSFWCGKVLDSFSEWCYKIQEIKPRWFRRRPIT